MNLKSIVLMLVSVLFIGCMSCSKDPYKKGQTAPEPESQETALKVFLNGSEGYIALTAQCKKVLDAAYMSQKFIEETTSYPNWAGYPVKLYEYTTGKDAKTGETKKGKVYMLNPSPEKLATWVATSCWKVKSSLDQTYLDKVCNQILIQSGAQFPVCGIVYEDMDGNGYFPYVFKDGVTSYVADTTKWRVESATCPGNYSCTDEQLEYCTHLTNSQLHPFTGTYARICSTTREQYTANGGKKSVGTSDSRDTRSIIWLDAVRELYQKAWKSDENELITAWCKANL